jgi:glutamate 5-kinase
MNTPLTVRSELPALRTLVVKVGSRLVTAGSSPAYRARVRALVADIAMLREAGVRVLLVSSGAIAHGIQILGLTSRPKTLPLKQACASVGQSAMMDAYARLFARRDLRVGQVLLTWDDLRDKKRYLNLRNTLFQLLDCGVVPIINENDSVSVDEINFGDNDTLGAQMALLVGAELYVMLTDVNGLYRGNPAENPDAEHIPVVHRLTPEIHALAGGSSSHLSVGGMTTKLRAAEAVTRSGMCAIIANGDRDRIRDILARDDLGTLFVPSPHRLSSRHRWIAFARPVSGSVTVDDGARKALVERGKSLLPAGIRSCSGTFKAGDMIGIVDSRGQTIARGLSNYSSADVQAIQGKRTDQIEATLGEKSFDEVVHRDNLALLEGDTK